MRFLRLLAPILLCLCVAGDTPEHLTSKQDVGTGDTKLHLEGGCPRDIHAAIPINRGLPCNGPAKSTKVLCMQIDRDSLSIDGNRRRTGAAERTDIALRRYRFNRSPDHRTSNA
jgi:hypothetical protein